MSNAITPNELYQRYPNIVTSLTNLIDEEALQNLPSTLIHLIRLRASQLNNCKFCQAMHIEEARKANESQERVDAVSTWLDSTLFNKQEQQALAWTETLTHLHAETDVTLQFHNTLAVFGEQNLIALTSIVLQINSWNRLAMGLGFNNN